MLVNTDFQTWYLIDRQLSRQPIGSHVWKSVLTNMDFKMDLTSNPGYRTAIHTSLWNIIPMPLCLASPGPQPEFRWLRWWFSVRHRIPRTCDIALAAYEMLSYQNICVYEFKPMQHGHAVWMAWVFPIALVRFSMWDKFWGNVFGVGMTATFFAITYCGNYSLCDEKLRGWVGIFINVSMQYKVIIDLICHIIMTPWYGNVSSLLWSSFSGTHR